MYESPIETDQQVARNLTALFEPHADYRTPFQHAPDLQERAVASFSPDYFAARSKFLDAAVEAGGQIENYQLFKNSRSGSPLFIDFAVFKNGTPEKVLLHISGTHGPEGYSGSAIQHDLLSKGVSVPENSMIVFCHALNAFGMAEFQRTNEDNIDPNRNYRGQRDDYQLGICEDYSGLDWLIHPNDEHTLAALLHQIAVSPEARDDFLTRMADFLPGQNDKPDGLFYTGESLIQSFTFLNHFLDTELPLSVKDVFIVDVHTGLGDFGDEMLFSNRQAILSNDTDLYQNLTMVDGLRITAPDPAAENFYEAQGDTVQGATRHLNARGIACNGICQEFGTYSFSALVASLITENHYRTSANERPEYALDAIKEMFNPDSIEWQKSILARGQRLYDGLVESFLLG